MDDSANGRYDIIVGGDLLTELGLNLKFSNNGIEGYCGPFKGSTAPMVDLGTYEFTDYYTWKSNPKNSL